MEAKGEAFDPKRLWPTPSPRSLEFSNHLALIIGQLPTGLANYASVPAAIVQKHGGSLQYQTQVHHGTTFGIVLPQVTE